MEAARAAELPAYTAFAPQIVRVEPVSALAGFGASSGRMAASSAKGKPLAGPRLDLSLSGPTVMRAKGGRVGGMGAEEKAEPEGPASRPSGHPRRRSGRFPALPYPPRGHVKDTTRTRGGRAESENAVQSLNKDAGVRYKSGINSGGF